MKQSLMLFTTIYLIICLLNIGCGIVQISTSDTKQKTDAITSPALSQWIGNYKGTVKRGYGNSTKTVDSPAELTITQFAEKISFALKPRFESNEWRISVEPSKFLSLSTHFVTSVNQRGRQYSCEISIKLEGENLSGNMKIFSSSVLTDFYTLKLTKTK